MMKKLLLLAFMAVGMTAHAETLVTNDDEDKQIENKGGVELGKDEDDRWSMHLAVGVDIPTGAPDGVDFAPFRSWEINWTVVQYDYTPGKSNTTLSAGLGFNWRTYTLKGHKDGFFKMNDVIGIGETGKAYDDFSFYAPAPQTEIQQALRHLSGCAVELEFLWPYPQLLGGW